MEILQGDNREGELLDCGVKLKCINSKVWVKASKKVNITMSSENRIDDAIDSDEHVAEVKDRDDIPVFLAEAVWNEHILLRHPEIEPYKDLITQTIENPDVRHIDPEDERVMLYHKAVPEEYNNQRTGFISSVYFVSKVKRGGRIV